MNHFSFSVNDESLGLTFSHSDLSYLSLYVLPRLYPSLQNLNTNATILISSKNRLQSLLFWIFALHHEHKLVIVDEDLLRIVIESQVISCAGTILFVDRELSFPFYVEVLFSDNSVFSDIPCRHYYYFSLEGKKSSIITFTSGTTGTPKLISRSLSSYISAASDFLVHTQLVDRECIVPASFHEMYLGSFFNLFIIPYVAGWNVVFPKLNGILFWANIETHLRLLSINLLWITPSILKMLLRLGKLSLLNNLDLVIVVGTDILNRDLWIKSKSIFDGPLLNTYGLSETLFISSQTLLEHSSYSCGNVLPNVTIHLDSANIFTTFDTNQCDFSSSKELSVITPYICNEYLYSKSPFVTGDIVQYNNKSSELRVVGRSKDIIIKSGMNISPAYIESVIQSYEYIDQSCIYPIQNDDCGQLVGCTIVLTDNNQSIISEVDLKAKLNSSLPSSYSIDLLRFADSLPKTISGKVNKSDLALFPHT